MIDRFRFGLNRIICPSLDIEEFFQLANELELQWLELRNDLPGKEIIDSFSPQETRYLAQHYNVQICSINALQKFNVLEEIDRIKEELSFLLNSAREINCKAIIMCPLNEGNNLRSPEKEYQETVHVLRELMPLFKDNSILGYIEPLGFSTSSLSSVLNAMKAIKEVGYEGYKIVHDSFHHSIGPDHLKILAGEYDIQYTGLMHISAVTADIPPEQYRDEHRHMDFSGDRLNSKEQIDFFIQHGYQGIISFEPFASKVQALDKEGLKKLVNQSIDYLRY